MRSLGGRTRVLCGGGGFVQSDCGEQILTILTKVKRGENLCRYHGITEQTYGDVQGQGTDPTFRVYKVVSEQIYLTAGQRLLWNV